VELLLEKEAGKIVAGTRKPEKLADLAARGVTVRQADFDDPKELETALAGVDRVLIISTDAIDRPGRRLAQHKAAVFAPDHLGTEQALKASGMSWTILRDCWYTDYLIPTLAPAVASGQLIAATGEGGAPYVTREDCAQGAAAALASADTSNRTWNITGPAVVTWAELAKLAGELTGHAVTYVPVDAAERTAQLIAAGTPEPIAKMLVSGQLAIAHGKMGTATTAVKELTGREPVSVREFLSARRAALTPAAQTVGR
jgi:NAD(P)H dehydrogenase (quinone)